jgi:hypothetical protein
LIGISRKSAIFVKKKLKKNPPIFVNPFTCWAAIESGTFSTLWTCYPFEKISEKWTVLLKIAFLLLLLKRLKNSEKEKFELKKVVHAEDAMIVKPQNMRASSSAG